MTIKNLPTNLKRFAKKNFTPKTLLNVAVLLAVFGVGVGFGQGRISFGPDAVFRQPVSKGLPADFDYSGVEEVYDALRQSYDGQLDVATLEDGLKEGLVKAAGDPYTEYLNLEASQEFNEQLNGSFEGIGAELSKQGSSIVIISPISGFPAEKAGLKSKDRILKINDENAEDMTVSKAVEKIRGPKGSKVNLEIARDTNILNFEITRDTITLPSVKGEITEDNIGIITVSRFGNDTAALAQKTAREFADKGVKSVILDLRNNPGGVVNAAVELSSLWLDPGAVVLAEKRDGEIIKTLRASGDAPLKGIPTVVLVNEGSASASEITAGALKDHGAATVIGDKSFGKGSVQEIRRLINGGSLKVTIARWFTPNGRNIDKEGIEPDKTVKITEKDIEKKHDAQLEAAKQTLQKN